jgi:calcineurin-like phosphoesterase family protein
VTIFLTSDHHFGHGNILVYCDRPWDNAEDMTEGLVSLWNETVQPDDTVFYLGDFAMGKIAETLPVVGRLNGTKLLVPGNHDRCWRGEAAGAKLERWTRAYLDAGFAAIFANDPAITVDGTKLQLCHFPYRDIERHYNKYDTWAPDDDGHTFLAHGHIHQGQLGQRMVNVGVDEWDYRPIPVEWVMAKLREDME